MEHKSNTADIGPQIMEYRPNSVPENSTSIKAESSPHPLESPLNSLIEVMEHYVLKNITGSWDRPKHKSYITKEERLRSYVLHEWPRDVIPITDALREAGFFAIGKNFNTIF